MNDTMTNSKKGMVEFLLERERYFLDEEPNPFTEMRMVSYINNGLNKLDEMKLDDDTIVTMFDNDGVLEFRVGE